MVITKKQKMVTTVNKDLYINGDNIKYVGETSTWH